jgi:hypothetical protein
MLSRRWRPGDMCGKWRERGGPTQARRPSLIRGTHGHVNVFENFAALNAAAAVGGLNQVVAWLPAMLASQCVDECQRFGELLRLDQKTRAVDVPCSSRIHVVHPWGRESQ